jgi:hypothetical protein
VFAQDEQMSSRFKPLRMPRWTPGANLGSLLATLENRTPLRKPSDLKSQKMMAEISKRAEGSLGDTCDLVRECAIAAIRDPAKPERITLDQIKKLDWVPPTKRKLFGKIHAASSGG